MFNKLVTYFPLILAFCITEGILVASQMQYFPDVSWEKVTVFSIILGRLRTPVTVHVRGIFIRDSMKPKVILHWITMKYAVSRIKMPHVREFASLISHSYHYPYKSNGKWIIDVNHGNQKLDKQDQPLTAHRITKWENYFVSLLTFPFFMKTILTPGLDILWPHIQRNPPYMGPICMVHYSEEFDAVHRPLVGPLERVFWFWGIRWRMQFKPILDSSVSFLWEIIEQFSFWRVEYFISETSLVEI